MALLWGVALAGVAVTLYIPRKVRELTPKSDPILFFDGVCNLCHGFVGFALKYERSRRLKFGAIQKHGDKMRELGAGAFAEGGDQHLRTVVLVDDGKIYIRSDAALRVIAMFDAPYKYLVIFHVLPVSIRDAGYKLIAKWRYRIFGETDQVRNPPPEFKSSFL